MISVQLSKLPVKYKPYFEEMELKNKLLHQVPRKLRKRIIHAKYNLATGHSFVCLQ